LNGDPPTRASSATAGRRVAGGKHIHQGLAADDEHRFTPGRIAGGRRSARLERVIVASMPGFFFLGIRVFH
jgi:hypothetical protein